MQTKADVSKEQLLEQPSVLQDDEQLSQLVLTVEALEGQAQAARQKAAEEQAARQKAAEVEAGLEIDWCEVLRRRRVADLAGTAVASVGPVWRFHLCGWCMGRGSGVRLRCSQWVCEGDPLWLPPGEWDKVWPALI